MMYHPSAMPSLPSRRRRRVRWFPAALVISIGAALFFLCALLWGVAWSAQQSLAWDYGATPVTGFKLYCGTVSRTYAASPVATVNASVKTAAVTFPQGRQYCAVRAYDAAGESPDSNEVTFIDAPTLRLALIDSGGRVVAVLGLAFEPLP